MYDDPRGLRKGRGGGGATKVLALLLAVALFWGWRSHSRMAADRELVSQTQALQEKWKAERLDQKKKYDGLNQKLVSAQSQLRVTKIDFSRAEHRLHECEKRQVDSGRFMEEGKRERQMEKLTQDLAIARMATQECEGKLLQAELERNELDRKEHEESEEIKNLKVEISVLQLELQKYRPDMNLTVSEEEVERAIYNLEHPEEAETIEEHHSKEDGGKSMEGEMEQGARGVEEPEDHGEEGHAEEEHAEEEHGEEEHEGEHGEEEHEGGRHEQAEQEPEHTTKAPARRPRKVTKPTKRSTRAKASVGAKKNWKTAKKAMKPPSL